MKLSTTTTLFTLFLLSATITTSHLPSATADFIRDSQGEPLLNGGTYYIVSAIRGAGGGGVTLARTGNEICPASVVQEHSDLKHGKRVIISSPYRILYITEGLPLNLTFSSAPDCANAPPSWAVLSSGDNGLPVKLRGEYDDILNGWFQIERTGNDNKIKFSPSGDDRSLNIAVHSDENRVRQLVATEKDRAFAVRFVRADRHHLASASII